MAAGKYDQTLNLDKSLKRVGSIHTDGIGGLVTTDSHAEYPGFNPWRISQAFFKSLKFVILFCSRFSAISLVMALVINSTKLWKCL